MGRYALAWLERLRRQIGMSSRQMTCDHCDEVIGVYEPMVVVTEAGARETSTAAEPSLGLERAERYH